MASAEVSLAAFNAAAYLLGIGDRHLDNFLIDAKSGNFIGIDFGYSFGMGALLPVPEIAPTRLTPAFQGVVKPDRYANLFACGIRACRHIAEELLGICEVFAKEPLLEWDSGKEASALSPEVRLSILKKKLNGESPSAVLLEELGYNKNDWVKAMLAKEVNWIRKMLGLDATGLSAEKQAEEVIRLSTDRNILGRGWQGWSPHV